MNLPEVLRHVATPQRVLVFDDAATLGNHLAARILARIAGQGRYLLGCPSGRSPRPVYQAMAARLRDNPQDLSQLILVMMDEYLLGDWETGLHTPPASAHFSCRGFAEREIIAPLNAVLPPPWRIQTQNLWFPDPQNPAHFDSDIKAQGGVDLFLLASGAGDGHIAFNPPGSPPDGPARVVSLADQTRRDNLATFPDFADLGEVPRYGVSVGVGTIARAKAAAMILTGPDKAQAAAKIIGQGGYDPDWPATIVNTLPHADILLDRAALPKTYGTAHA